MSKFLSLSWFKSKIETAVEKVVANKIDDLIRQENGEDVNIKPYTNVKMVNDVLTVVLNDGNIISKPGASQEDFNRVRNARTEEEIMQLVICPEVLEERLKREAEIAKIQALQDGIKSLANYSDEFIVDGNSVYFKGIERSMPQIMVEEILMIVNKYGVEFKYSDEYLALKRFFMWCCLNPRAEVAHELYRFLRENSFRITKQGFFVALRNVVTLHGSNELVHFISNTYNKVKAVWKKKPDDYTLFLENGQYKLVHNSDLYKEEEMECGNCEGSGEYWDEESSEEYGDDPGYVTCDICDGSGVETVTTAINHGHKIGGLTELYLDLPNRHENRFTDDWTKTFDIRIGKVVNMPQEECNWSTQDCAAAGLHFTADQIHYVGCGDQSVLVLINPMKVVGIGQHKGRCYEYLPIMTVPREEATQILHDLNFSTLELDEDYAIRELENLENKAKEGFATESRKYEFNIPQVSTVEIKNIIRSLEDMKYEISNRVVDID